MDIFEIMEKIKDHREYQNLSKEAYLGFIYFADDEYQVGFYLPNTRTYKVFYIKPGKKDTDFLVNEELHDKVPSEIDLDKIVIFLNDAKMIAQEVFQNNYPHDRIYKAFYILQNTDLGNIWNITFLTNKMKLINLKICAETGRLIKASEDNVFDFNIMQ